MTGNLRYRGSGRDSNKIIEYAKNLDAFKKVPEKYTESTEIGGTLSLLSRLLIVYLIYKEVKYYQDAKLRYQFTVDTELDKQVAMHVDITVAMPCKSLSGVDLMDETQQDVFAYGTLQREDVWWELSQNDRENFERFQHMNTFLREGYHSIQDILWKDIIKSNDVHETENYQNKQASDEKDHDACRLHGTLTVNKVAGVLHLVGGAQPVVGLFADHWLIEFRRVPANFSHRINRLSFGQYSKRLVQSLEGDEVILKDEAVSIQYFLKIVPTEIHNIFSTINTYQYAVTENIRKLDDEKNSYGSPGIYFKYDWSALKITVRTNRDSVLQLVIRLCSIIAGIIVISGLLNAMLLGLSRILIRNVAPQLLYENEKLLPNEQVNVPNSIPSPIQSPPLLPVMPNNNLLITANQMSHFDPTAGISVPVPLPLPVTTTKPTIPTQ